MSDLPPDESSPRQPAGDSVAPPRVVPEAVPAPAPDRTAMAPAPPSEQGAAPFPPPWAVPGAGAASPSPGPPAAAGPRNEGPSALAAAGTAGPAASPPPGWYGAAGGPPGWYAPIAAATAPAPRASMIDRARLLPTAAVAVIIAVVVLGGIGLDAAIAAPSAGTVAIGDSATITAAPGWVLISPAGDTSNGVQLQKANATLTAQVASTDYTGDSASMLPGAEQSLGNSAQISYGDAHRSTVGGNDTTYVAFEAVISSAGQSGIVDGELVCMVVAGDGVVVVVAAPQGYLDPVIDDVSTMLKSVRIGR